MWDWLGYIGADYECVTINDQFVPVDIAGPAM
jgi:hypothetical protein